MKNLNFLTKLFSPWRELQSSNVSTTLALTVGSPSAHRRVGMLKPIIRMATILCLLVPLGIGNAWGTMITLTESDVRSYTSYDANEQTFTNSVSFGFINLMTNNANGTPTGWGKNQVMQTKNGGYLYNKAPLSTIQHVKVYLVVNDNALSVGYGNTEKPTTNTIAKASATSGSQSITYTSYVNKTTTIGVSGTATTYDFDLSSYSATYFTIIPGGSTYIWKVEITYAAPSCSVKPTVGSDLTSVSATVNSITATVPISAIGGCNITENGLVYSTSVATPEVGTANCTKVTTTACGSTAANKEVTITGLACGQSYYVRGYATNGAGTEYTNVTTQSTSACPTYTVTLKDDDSTLPQASAGASVTLPSRTGCTGYTFAGWTKTWTESQTSWTTTAPTIIPAGSYTPTANENLYPVYTKTESGGGSTTKNLTNAEIESFYCNDNNCDPKTTVYDNGPFTITSSDGNWYGVCAAATNPNTINIRSNTATISGVATVPYLRSPEYSSDIASISITHNCTTDRTLLICSSATANPANDKIATISITSSNTTGVSADLPSGVSQVYLYSSSGAIMIKSIAVTVGGSTTSYISVSDCGNFPNDATIFIQAETTSAWSDANNDCVKAWFHIAGGSEAAQSTYWLFDADPYSSDAGKKLFAAIVPASGNLPYLDIQRFSHNCNTYKNKNGGCSYSDANGSNTIRSTGKSDTNNANDDYIRWNATGVTMELWGSPDSWAAKLADVTDQGGGEWSGTYNNFTPSGTSATFKIKTNYNGWIGNKVDGSHQNEDATLSDMIVGSTYNVTATLDITDHSLVMSKTFVKGTVHFDKQSHGGAGTIADLTNVAAGSKISAPSPAPTDDDYIFGGWFKEPGCTNEWDFENDEVNETMTLYAKWTLKQAFTVRFHTTSSEYTDITEAGYQQGVTPPSMPLSCGDWNFVGWSTTEGSSSSNTTPIATVTLTGGKYYPTSAGVNLYPVFTKNADGDDASLTKMTTGNTLSNGDNIVIVAHDGTDNDIALFQKTISSSYVDTWSYDGATSTVAEDNRNYLTVTTAIGGWYLGDATNGYLYNSENNLYCGETQVVWTIVDNNDGTFKLETGNRYLSHRSDLSTAKWRMGGTNHGTSGVVNLDIYKYIAGTMYYYSYPACIICSTPTLSFASASLTKTLGEEVSNDLTIVGNTLSATVTYYSSNTSKATVNPTNGQVTLKQATASDAPITITAILSAATNDVDACTNSVAESYSLLIKSQIQWFSNGEEVAAGSQTTAAFSDQELVFPSNPSPAGTCASDGKVFIGWTTIADWDSDEVPAPLYTSSSSVKVNKSTNFYAVFATSSVGPEVSTLKETMSYDTWAHNGDTDDKTTYRLFGDGSYVESAQTLDFSKLDKVVVYGGTFGGDDYDDISICKADGTVWKTDVVTGSKATKANTYTGGASLSGTAKLRVYSTCGDGSANGVRISAVDIYTLQSTTVYSGYKTNCCDHYADPTVSYESTTLETGGNSSSTPTISGETHGTVSYSSSDASIASVNSSTGVVTSSAGNPGWVTITARWPKTGNYCAKEVSVNFTITGNVTITFNANGGTGSMTSQSIPFNTATALNTMSGITAPSGKTFVGWNTEADGSGKKYTNGETAKFTTHTTLYAQWATAYTITLHRNGVTEVIGVLSTDFPYTLPTAESDYCDSWTFAGWSSSSVANNSTNFTRVTEATTAANADFYAVYKGDPTNADAYIRITSAGQLTTGDYVFAAYSNGKKYVMTNSYNTTYNDYGEITTTETAESGPNYFLASAIDAGSVYVIGGETNSWTIKNKNAPTYYINLANADNTSYDWYTTYTTNNTYKISPNGLYWTVLSNASVSKKYFDATHKTKDGDKPARVVFTVYDKHSGSLQLYKAGTAPQYKYTSSPSGEGCSSACTSSGAQFTYPTLTKTISSSDFVNTVIYSGTPNTATPSYSSSNIEVATVNATSGLVHIEGVGETTITMTQTRDGSICGATLSYTLTVTSPTLDVVKITDDDKIIIEHDFEGVTTASTGMENSVTDIKGTIADDIFISKYYEAANEMKLFGLYNGTEHDIDLSELRVRSGSTSWGDHGLVTLKDVAKLGVDFPNYKLPAFSELIFWSNSSSSDANGYNAQLCSCIDMEIGGKKFDYDDMLADKVPNWYRVTTVAGVSKAFDFNGDDAIILERSENGGLDWTIIDLFGAGTASAPAYTKMAGDDRTMANNGNGAQFADLNDNPGGYYWIFDRDEDGIPDDTLSTNRFYLMRNSDVKSGATAIGGGNATSFATLGTEWHGEGIGGSTNMIDYCKSGDLFSTVAEYDYASYYTKYETYTEEWRAENNGDGTLTISLGTGKLAELACSKLRITVTDSKNNTKTAQVEYNVPIVIKSGNVSTMDAVFNAHDKDECKVCDVVVMDGGVLMKANPTPAQVVNDREEVYNVDVYPGGELYVPAGTEFSVNTLTVRSEGDNVGLVDVQGSLNCKNSTLMHFKRFNTEGSNYRWYFFTLPYDCNVSEVTFSNGEPAVHGVDFEVDWYDGAQRASTQANGNWKSIAVHPDFPNIIKAGYGYTIAVERQAGHKNTTLLFPMANFEEVNEQLAVPVGNWGAGDDNVPVNHKGWNVVGNPFLTNYKAQSELDINGELRAGIIQYSVEQKGWVQVDNNINYLTVAYNGGASGYDQVELTNYTFKPFQSYIIQAGGDEDKDNLRVLFKNAYKKHHGASVVRRKEQEYETGELTPVWIQVDLTNTSGETDKTTLILSDRYTPEYDMTYDLSKMRGDKYTRYTRPVLASILNGYELVFNALPDSIAEAGVPLTYYSRAAGNMRFELSKAYQWGCLEEVILHDAQLGVHHNLLTDGAYEFTTTAGEKNNRFSISAKVNRFKAPEIATGTDGVDLQNVRITVHDHNLCINGLEEGTSIYVFDMSGKLVARQMCSQPFVSFVIPTSGVYNVRIEGKHSGSTIRTIVY